MTGHRRRSLMRAFAAAGFALSWIFASGPSLAQAVGGQGQYGHVHEHMWGGWGWPHFVFGPLMMILIVGVVIFIAVFAIRRLGDSRPGHRPPGDALELLKQRYARGEIEREEYLKMKDDLQ